MENGGRRSECAAVFFRGLLRRRKLFFLQLGELGQ